MASEAKRKKLGGAHSYKCSFKEEWMDQYPISRSDGNPHAFYCIPCKKNVSCSHQGLADVTKHCKGTTHVAFEKAIKNTRSMSSFFNDNSESSNSLMEKTIRAEVLHTNFMVQHNLSFLTAEHLSPLYAKMFPDSKIARNFKCSRTKTTAILNEAMQPSLKTSLVDYMKKKPFSLVNDGSSDTGIKKMNALCAYIFDVNNCKRVEFKFYNMCTTTGEDCSKAYTLFAKIHETLNDDVIHWSNVVSFGLDNTNSNMGCYNSLKSRILKENSSCFVAGCNCHLVHLAAGKGGKAYASISGFNCEEHQVDLYYFFKGSSRRKGILVEYLEFVELDWDNFVRYVKTRWLSLEQCCNKEVKKLPALKSMFLSRVEKETIDKGNSDEQEDGKSLSTKFKRLKSSYESPLIEAHLLFYTSALPLFTHYNLFLQRGDPLAHKVFPVTKALIRKIASRFLASECYEGDNIVSEETIDDANNYLPLDEVFIGFSTRQKIRKLFNEGDIDKNEYNVIPKAAIAFYRESLRYVITKMDMSHSFWQRAVWVDFFNRKNALWSDVEYFIDQYSDILNFDDQQVDLLFEEFTDYKTFQISELPDNALTDALLEEYEDRDEYRLDVIWYHLYHLKSLVGSNFRFRNLFSVAHLVLVTPHSNAGIERVYALIKKNKREGSDRNRLDIEGSLSAILAVKMDQPEAFNKCYDFKPSEDLLKKAKKATVTYNKAHSSISQKEK